jgi:hypothetical protein
MSSGTSTPSISTRRTAKPEHLPGLTHQIDTVDDETTAQTLDERARFEERWHAVH